MLTEPQLDALTEMINIGVSRSASILNDMVQAHVHLQVPVVRILTPDQVRQELEAKNIDKFASVHLPFNGDVFTGETILMFDHPSASRLVSLLTAESEIDLSLDEERSSTLTEVGNILLNGVMGSISNILRDELVFSVPYYVDGSIKNLIDLTEAQDFAAVILAETRFSVLEHEMEGDMMLMLGTRSLALLAETLDKLVAGV